ncbi:hypothetical protein [Halovenus salina]|uniref:DUF8163 domain-containing protein n=1 Tax=Halovenus salina TaxID=1510225 RepID=A0ABD5W4A7_9EURY
MSTTRSEEPEPTSTRQSNSRFRPPIWGEDTRLVPAASTHTWLSALAGLLFVAGLSFLAGPVGMLAGIATTGVWYLLGSPYALAAGTVLAVAVVPTPADPLAVTLVGAPLLVLVLAPVVTTSHTGGLLPSSSPRQEDSLRVDGSLPSGFLFGSSRSPYWVPLAWQPTQDTASCSSNSDWWMAPMLRLELIPR